MKYNTIFFCVLTHTDILNEIIPTLHIIIFYITILKRCQHKLHKDMVIYLLNFRIKLFFEYIIRLHA